VIGRLRRSVPRREHPSSLVLSEYLDGELALRERHALDAHLRDCSRCRALLESLSRTVQALGSLGSPSAERRPGLADSIVAALRAESGSPSVPDGGARTRSPAPTLSVVGGVTRTAAGTPATLEGSVGDATLPGRPRSPLSVMHYCLRGTQLRLTLPLAVIAGAALSLINQWDMIFNGRLTLGMCGSCAMNFVVPFLALNLALAIAAGVSRHRRT
jgi:anti-sigma factor RsiW